MANEHIVELNEENWDDVLKSEQPVLVDFWASWCRPCLALAPVIDQVAAEVAGEVKVAKATIEDEYNHKIAGEHGIRGIPALLIFKGGKEVERVSARSAADIIAAVKAHV